MPPSDSSRTRALWARQDGHAGDRWRLFTAVGEAVDVRTAIYPGSFVDIAPSFVFASVTYVDTDDRAAAFFSDGRGVAEIIAEHRDSLPDPEVRFIHGDYRQDLDAEPGSFDLLVSLYAGFVSEHCTELLRVGGTLLVNSSHGDAAMASIDSRYELSGVVQSASGRYSVRSEHLDAYMQPRKPVIVTKDLLHETGRGVAYTRSPFAYLFTRIR